MPAPWPSRSVWLFCSPGPSGKVPCRAGSRWSGTSDLVSIPESAFPPSGLLLVLCLWSLAFFCGVTGLKCPLVRTVAVIASAAMAVTLPGLLARRPFWATPLVAVVITAAALHAFGLLETTVDRLAATGLKLGNLNISLLDLLVAPLAFLCFWTLAGMLSRFTESRLADARDIPPAVRVLAAKFTNFFLILAAIGFTLAVVGIDLTALTVFGGALGLGIGFGLQKVVSNLISGVILLLDKSIKPGDVIEIGDTYGRINGLRTRYVSVVTRDNKEHLIPNEDLITQPVINWSFTDRLVRLRAPIGIAYGSDVRLAIDLCEKAAAASPRVRKSPSPSVSCAVSATARSISSCVSSSRIPPKAAPTSPATCCSPSGTPSTSTASRSPSPSAIFTSAPAARCCGRFS